MDDEASKMAEIILSESRLIVTRTDARTLGAKRYFTSIPCKHGHIAERMTINDRCVTCLLIGTEKWRVENPDKVRAMKRRAYQNKPDLYRKQKRDWARNNPEKTKASRKKDMEKHKDRYEKYWKEWYSTNSHIVVANAKKWALENPEKAKRSAIAKEGRRRAAIKAGESAVTASVITAIIAKQKFKCAWCGTCIKKSFHMDHVIPLSKGGAHSPSNLVGSCPTCNIRKSAKDPITWARELGKLI